MADKKRVFRLIARRLDRAAADGGFTLVEAVVSTLVAALVLSAVALALVSNLHGSTTARVNQQAADVGTTQLEQARLQSYSNLAMSTTDSTLTTSGDSRLLTSGCPSGSTMCVAVPNPSGSGTVTEGLVTSAGSAYVTKHIQTITSGTNNVPFTVSTYVTKPSDETGAAYKRVTVYVSWKQYGVTHTRVDSTVVANTKRGLPLPNFKLTTFSCSPTAYCSTSSGGMSVTVNPGATVVFGFKVSNLGARDAWDFTSNNEGLGWTYYLDNGDGTLTTSGTNADSLMADNDGDGTRDTGEINTNSYAVVWATRTIPSTAANGSSAVNFTATSVAQPSLGAGVSSQSQATTVTVTSSVITASPTPSTTASSTPSPTPTTSTSTPATCTAVGSSATTGSQYYLHNTTDQSASTGGSTSALYPMSFSTTQPSAASLADYSTDDGLGSHSGRTLSPVSSFNATSNSASSTATFQYQLPTNNKINSGTAYVTVWAKPASSSASDTVSLMAGAEWRKVSNNSSTYASEGTSSTVSGTGCGDWRQFTLAVPIATGFNPGNGDYIQIVVQDLGSSSVQLAYDTTGYAATTVWPVG